MDELKDIRELKKKTMEELKEQAREIVKKGRLSAGDVDTSYKLAKTIYYLCETIEGAEEESGYSEAGNWDANIRGQYGDNASYAGRRRGSMGRYTRRGRGGNYSRDGGYSRNDGGMYSMDEGLIQELEEKMHKESDPVVKDAMKLCISAMRK